jgi:hypothetical protein
MSKQENARRRNDEDIEQTIYEALMFCAGRCAASNYQQDAKSIGFRAQYIKGEIREFMQRRHTIRRKVTK